MTFSGPLIYYCNLSLKYLNLNTSYAPAIYPLVITTFSLASNYLACFNCDSSSAIRCFNWLINLSFSPITDSKGSTLCHWSMAFRNSKNDSSFLVCSSPAAYFAEKGSCRLKCRMRLVTISWTWLKKASSLPVLASNKTSAVTNRTDCIRLHLFYKSSARRNYPPAFCCSIKPYLSHTCEAKNRKVCGI